MVEQRNSQTQLLEWQEWQQHPQTQILLKRLQQVKQETMEAWSREAFIGSTGEESLAQNATALGGMRVLNQVIEMVTGE